jgi:hypothetical protein
MRNLSKRLSVLQKPSFNRSGARVLAYKPALRGWAWTMALDPEELVTLTNHGTMKLRSAVARAMMLLPEEHDFATIVREGEPTILYFDLIMHLSALWDKQDLSVYWRSLAGIQTSAD